MIQSMVDDVPAITLDGLSVRLGSRMILHRLDASLKGRAIGLLGPNGAGKTTLLRTLLGFYRPSEGRASVLGHSLARRGKAIRGLIGYMPESDSFISHLSAVRFLRLMAELSGLPPRAALERAHEALFYVGLGEARYRPVGTFSTGMKQMVKLAQALVHGPRLIMLDEPTNGLDPPARSRMLELLAEIRDGGRAHLLLSSHILGDIEKICDEVLILKDGRIAARCDLEAERKANRSFVELELLEQNENFVSELYSLGCELARAGSLRLKVVMPPGINTRTIYESAGRHRAVLRRMESKKNSLQDIFLNAMEEDVDGGL